MNAIFHQWLADEARAFEQMSVNRNYDIVTAQHTSGRPTKRRVDFSLESHSRAEAANIGAVPCQGFETLISRRLGVAISPIQGLRLVVDIVGIRGHKRDLLFDPYFGHFRDHPREHDIIAA